MPKPSTIPIPELILKLRKLKVSRSIEKTDKYDNEITLLEKKIDNFFYGV